MQLINYQLVWQKQGPSANDFRLEKDYFRLQCASRTSLQASISKELQCGSQLSRHVWNGKERPGIQSAIQRVQRQAISQHYSPGNQQTPSVKISIGHPILGSFRFGESRWNSWYNVFFTLRKTTSYVFWLHVTAAPSSKSVVKENPSCRLCQVLIPQDQRTPYDPKSPQTDREVYR